MAEISMGAVVGVIASLIGWWILARAFIPRLLVSAKIGKVPETRREQRWRYRIKVVKARRWPLPHRPVIDVKVIVTLQIRGLDPTLPDNWNNYNVPVPNGGAIPMVTNNTVVQIRTYEIDLADKPMFASQVTADPDGTDLKRLLCFGAESRLRFMVTASNAYTHATTTKIAYYRSDDLALGKFRNVPGRVGLDIAEMPEESVGDALTPSPGDASAIGADTGPPSDTSPETPVV